MAEAADDAAPGRSCLLGVWLVVLLIAAAVGWFGVRPGLRQPLGDFANYYAASRVALSGEDLTPAYSDFLWFQQQIDACGIAGQLGGFIPHPPAAALAMAPLAGLDPIAAKRLWTSINIAMLALAVYVIARLADIGIGTAALATLATGIGLANDLALGQVYIPVLLSIACGLLLVERGRPFSGGLAIGALVAVKPVAVPFIVYFALKREWRVLGGAASAAMAVSLASISVLGWNVHAEYLRTVLPHQIAGELQDPFHPLWQSWSSLGKRLFTYDPTLNPEPAVAIPGGAAALAGIASAVGWGAVVLGIRAAPDARRLHFALIVIGLLAFAPGGASYHMVLLAIPFALAAGEALRRERHRLLAAGAMLAALNALPLPALLLAFDGGWTTPLAYPRLWILCTLLCLTLAVSASTAVRPPARRELALVAVVALAAAATGALRGTPSGESDGAIPLLANTPANVEGAPAARPEMVAGDLTFLAANPERGRYDRYDVSGLLGSASITEPQLATLSPDRTRLAFVRDDDIWVRDLGSGAERRLTLYPGIDRDPCWRDDATIVFATDRGRGLAYTTLYEIDAR